MSRPASHNDYDFETEIVPGVFIDRYSSGSVSGGPLKDIIDKCQVNIVDDEGEVYCEVFDDSFELYDALCAVIIAASGSSNGSTQY